MSATQEMHYFDENCLYRQEQRNILDKYNGTSGNNFESVKNYLLSEVYPDIASLAEDAISVEDIVIIAEANKLGPEYARAVSDGLGTEEKKVALYGFHKNLNIIEQIKGGESLSNLIMLIDASCYDDFILNDFFDESRSFINYPKLKAYLNYKR